MDEPRPIPEPDEPQELWADEAPLPSTVQLYLDDIGRIPLLTPEEEVTLFRRIEAGRLVAAVRRELMQRHGREPETHAVVAELVRRLERGLEAARAAGPLAEDGGAGPGLACLWRPELRATIDGEIPEGLVEQVASRIERTPRDAAEALRDLSVTSRILPREFLDRLDAAARALGVGPSAALDTVDLSDAARAVQQAVLEAQAAKDRVVQANLRFVVRIAKGYGSRRVPLLDLVQEGSAGLLIAAEKFDYRRGFRFTTYASWWVRQTIGRALINQDRLIRLPVHIWEQVSRYQRARADLLQRFQREPSPEQMAGALGVSLRRARRLATVAAQASASLEAPVTETGDTHLADLLESAQLPSPEEEAERTLLLDEVRGRLRSLTLRERQVVALRYGLDGGEGRTLEQVGRTLGLTRERVRQIETNALRKLRGASTPGAPSPAAVPA
ncbi:MAG TPA: sigma-70 family RNA polymerase sigma factor [Dehalococcoidia bacterium]